MRIARHAFLVLAVALGGCGNTTFPWTTGGSGSTPGGGGGGGATLQVSTSSLSFSAVQGDSAPTAKGVALSVSGTAVTTLYVTVANGGPPVSSATFAVISGVAQVIVSVVAPSTVGTTTGTVTIHVYADSARTQELGGSPATIAVSYTVSPAPTPGTYDVAPATLSFAAIQGDTSAPAAQDVTVTVQGNPVYLRATPSGITGLTATVTSSTAAGAVVRVAVPQPGAPGTASGSVTIRGYSDAALTKEVPSSPRTVAVTYDVAASQLATSPTSLTFTTPAGATPLAQTLDLTNADGSASWTASVTYVSGSGWLTVSPASGSSLPASASVSVTPPSAATTYSATIRVTARGVTRNVPVSLTVTRPRIVPTPTSLAFSSVHGQTTGIASQSLALATDNGASAAYTTSVTYGPGATGWLTRASSGTAPGTLGVGIGGTALEVGHYTATLTIAGPYGWASTDVPITYDVEAPVLTASPSSKTFAVDPYTTPDQISQLIALGDAGTPLAWSATSTASWLKVTPASGVTGAGALTASLVLPELETMAKGSYTAAVVLSYVAASGATVQVSLPVTLTLDLPLLDYVSPRVSVEGVGGDVILRGRGFGYPCTIRFGNAEATAVNGSSTMQLRATPPALAAGSYVVTVANALGLTRSRASLEVVPASTRAAASVASTGAKVKALFDDVGRTLYVANTGSGKIQRHREAAGWVLASDGSDELALAGLKNIALSPNGQTILAIAGTSLRTVAVDTFQLTPTQPTVAVPAATAYVLEILNDGRAVYAERPSAGSAWVFDPVPGTASLLGVISFTPGLAASKDGSRVAIFGADVSYPPQWVWYLDASANTAQRSVAEQDASLGAEDRHARRTLLFGCDSGCASKLYDASFAVLPGSVGSATTALALSSIGLDRAYTFDGAKLHAWNIEGPLDAAGLYGEAWKPAVTPKANPGNGPLLVLSADEQTAFLVGDQNVVVVPLPP